MKKPYALIAAFLVAAMTSINPVMGQNFNYFDTSFYSPILDETKSMSIYLPPGYDLDTATYPIVYYLHGATGSHAEVIQFMQSVEDMIDTGYIHHVLVVGLDGQCEPFAGSMYANSVLYGNYEDHIVQEAIPFAESILQTKNASDYRCIMGFAMGGYGSMKLAFKHPELFAATASYNGPLQFDTTAILWQPEVMIENSGPPYHYQYGAGIFTDLIFTGAGGLSPNLSILPYQVEFLYDTMGGIVDSVFHKWKEHDCSRLAKDLEPGSYHPALFFACGINDFLYFHPPNVCFADTLNDLGVDYKFITTDDGHVLSDEILSAGMHFLDSVMHDDYWIGNIEIEKPIAFSVSPNPASDDVKIRYQMPDAGYQMMELYTIAGVKIWEEVNEAISAGMHEVQVDVSDLPDGVYFVRIQAGKESSVAKLLVVH